MPRFLLFCIFAIPFAPQGAGFYLGSGLPILDLPRMLVLILIAWWFLRRGITGRIRWAWNGVTVSLAVLVATQFLSAVATGEAGALITWVGYVAYYYAIFVVVSTELRSYDDGRRVLDVVVVLAVALAALSCYEFLTQTDVYANARTAWEADPNATLGPQYRHIGLLASSGPFAVNTLLGYFFAATFFLVSSRLFSPDVRIPKILGAVIVVMMVLGLFVTQVRAAIVAVLVTAIVPAVVMPRQLGKSLLVAALLIVTILTLGVTLIPRRYVYADFVTNFYQNQTYRHNGVGPRLEAITAALEALIRRPALGYGTGSVTRWMFVGSGFSPLNDLPVYLVVAMESGVAAGAAFVLLVGLSLRALWRRYRSDPDPRRRATVMGLFLSILSYGIAILGAPRLDSTFIFFVLLAVANSLRARPGERGAGRTLEPSPHAA